MERAYNVRLTEADMEAILKNLRASEDNWTYEERGLYGRLLWEFHKDERLVGRAFQEISNAQERRAERRRARGDALRKYVEAVNAQYGKVA